MANLLGAQQQARDVCTYVHTYQGKGSTPARLSSLQFRVLEGTSARPIDLEGGTQDDVLIFFLGPLFVGGRGGG